MSCKSIVGDRGMILYVKGENDNTTGAISGAGNAYPSGTSKFTPVLIGVRITRSLVLYVYFIDRCLSFCTFSFGHCVVFSSPIMDSHYPFGIFKLFFTYA